MIREDGRLDTYRISFGFRALTGREPTKEKQTILEAERRAYRSSPPAARELLTAGENPADAMLPSTEIAAFTTVASTIMNFDATVILR